MPTNWTVARRATSSGSKGRLHGADLSVPASPATISAGADLTGASLSQTIFTKPTSTAPRLHRRQPEQTNFTGADLDASQLTEPKFINTPLTDALISASRT